jgi:hypothetical protein
MSELIKAARIFAIGSHQRINTLRNPALQSCDLHLKSVAQIVSSVSQDEEIIAAAWLHDVVEDTGATFGDVERRFGARVAKLVDELTVVGYPASGKRAARFALEKEHFATASAAAKTIKLADLIDTCRDLYKSEPASPIRYAAEARELADVLEGGEPRLLAQLRRDLEMYPQDPHPVHSQAAHPWEPVALPLTSLRVFERAFSAQDIAEPLLSFNWNRTAGEALEEMAEAGVKVAGVRKKGMLWGFMEAADLQDGTCEAACRKFASSQMVPAGGSLTDVVEVLTRHDWCFVSMLGTVVGVISRLDMQKPAVRMWLFGIITVAELEFTEMVRRRWPGESWSGLLSTQRLEKARHLRAERGRREESVQLLECLHLSDKMDILMTEPALLAVLGIPTASAARRAARNIKSLRNSLAHAQGFVRQDWPQVVRLARRVQQVFEDD